MSGRERGEHEGLIWAIGLGTPLLAGLIATGVLLFWGPTLPAEVVTQWTTAGVPASVMPRALAIVFPLLLAALVGSIVTIPAARNYRRGADSRQGATSITLGALVSGFGSVLILSVTTLQRELPGLVWEEQVPGILVGGVIWAIVAIIIGLIFSRIPARAAE